MITIIIPVYNGEKFIERCLDSILSQTVFEYEVIVVNDGSTDKSYDILSSYQAKDNRISVITTANNGVSAARNRGMENAKGEYITFVDIDDRLEPNALEKLYFYMKKYDADIVALTKRYINQQTVGVIGSQIEVWENDQIFIKALEDHKATHSVYAKLYKRELISDIRFVEGRRIHEDSFFLFQCFSKAKKVVYSDINIYNYYDTQGSASRSAFSDKYLDILYFANEKCNIITSGYPHYTKYIPEIIVRANMALLYNLCKTYDKKYREAERTCVTTIKSYKNVFKPKTRFEKRLFKILMSNLFWLYKRYIFVKMKRKM